MRVFSNSHRETKTATLTADVSKNGTNRISAYLYTMICCVLFVDVISMKLKRRFAALHRPAHSSKASELSKTLIQFYDSINIVYPRTERWKNLNATDSDSATRRNRQLGDKGLENIVQSASVEKKLIASHMII